MPRGAYQRSIIQLSPSNMVSEVPLASNMMVAMWLYVYQGSQLRNVLIYNLKKLKSKRTLTMHNFMASLTYVQCMFRPTFVAPLLFLRISIKMNVCRPAYFAFNSKRNTRSDANLWSASISLLRLFEVSRSCAFWKVASLSFQRTLTLFFFSTPAIVFSFLKNKLVRPMGTCLTI